MLTIAIKGTRLDLTPAITSYTEDKLRMLERVLTVDARAEIELEHTTRHQSGPVFRAEINLTAGSMFLRTEAIEEDLYAAIDVAKDEMMEAISQYKSKETTLVRRGGRMIKGFIRRMGWGE